ncbi:MAG: DUF559 domain-containing protein [Acidimicrobiales bacterium]
MHPIDDLVAELSCRQCGVFAAWQLDELSMPSGVRQRRLGSCVWLKHLPGVYGLPGIPSSFAQRLWIALLAAGPGAIVSFEAAAQLHCMPDVIRDRVTLTVVHGNHHRIPGATVHQISDVLPDHRTTIEGLPVTTIARTIVDLAAIVHRARLRHIVEDTKHAGLVTYAAVGECLTSIARPMKPGVKPLARVLDQLAGGRPVTQSQLEEAMLDLIAAAGLPRPQTQFPFPGRQFVNGCVDFAYPEAKLIIETDGRPWHTRIKDVARDRERDLEAARNGWQTIRFLHEHVVGDREGTAESIRLVRAERLALLGR